MLYIFFQTVTHSDEIGSGKNPWNFASKYKLWPQQVFSRQKFEKIKFQGEIFSCVKKYFANLKRFHGNVHVLKAFLI